MKIPVLQNFLAKLLAEDLPSLMVLPNRLEIDIPPSALSLAEAAVGRDAIMRAVATAVLQADAVESALMAALPLGPQTAAGGISLPESFQGELLVCIKEAYNLPVWGLPGQSNPYCRLTLGNQGEESKRNNETSQDRQSRHPYWNQYFQFLVEDPLNQVLDIEILDSPITGRPNIGRVCVPLIMLKPDCASTIWSPVDPLVIGEKKAGKLKLELSYKPFVDDDIDTGYRLVEQYKAALSDMSIKDIKSASEASSRAAVVALAAYTALAATKAAAARKAARALVRSWQIQRSQEQIISSVPALLSTETRVSLHDRFSNGKLPYTLYDVVSHCGVIATADCSGDFLDQNISERKPESFTSVWAALFFNLENSKAEQVEK
jgi:Ca2+-dependent lipid-binding protein